MNIPAIIKYLSVVALVFAITIGALFGYYNFFAPAPIVYTNLPFATEIASVQAGHIIPVTVRRCNTTGKLMTYQVSHTALNVDTRMLYVLPGPAQQDIMLLPGCTESISMINRLPLDMPAGKYQIYGTARIEGQLRDYLVPWYTQPFFVTGADK